MAMKARHAINIYKLYQELEKMTYDIKSILENQGRGRIRES